MCTSKRAVVRGSTFPDAGVTVVRALGAAACSMHSSDSYWFSASESPTNITFFPLHILSNATPSNLHPNFRREFSQTRGDIQLTQVSRRRRHYRPGRGARRAGLPPVLEVLLVGAAVPAAVELGADEGAGRRVVERVRLVHHPAPRREHVARRLRRRPGRRPVLVLPRYGNRRRRRRGGARHQEHDQHRREHRRPASHPPTNTTQSTTMER
ncbi:hypothetical protein EE612_001062 [Oryza sativa]|nr:hypothetical protein EE612_001062 [Oryza sativa]